MAALTDATRRKVHDILVNDTTISPTNRFIHVSQNWHGTANNEEYVSPTQYHEVMLNSMFAICPKGNSVKQFRIYVAIETGAIPVMDLKDGYVAHILYEWKCCFEIQINMQAVVDERVHDFFRYVQHLAHDPVSLCV